MTTKIGTNVVDLVFYHIFHNFFSQTIDYVTAHFTVTQPPSAKLSAPVNCGFVMMAKYD